MLSRRVMCFMTTSTAVCAKPRMRSLRVPARTPDTTVKTLPCAARSRLAKVWSNAEPYWTRISANQPCWSLFGSAGSVTLSCPASLRTWSSRRWWSAFNVAPTVLPVLLSAWVCAISPAGISHRPAWRTRTRKSVSAGLNGPYGVETQPSGRFDSAAADPVPSACQAATATRPTIRITRIRPGTPGPRLLQLPPVDAPPSAGAGSRVVLGPRVTPVSTCDRPGWITASLVDSLPAPGQDASVPAGWLRHSSGLVARLAQALADTRRLDGLNLVEVQHGSAQCAAGRLAKRPCFLRDAVIGRAEVRPVQYLPVGNGIPHVEHRPEGGFTGEDHRR